MQVAENCSSLSGKLVNGRTLCRTMHRRESNRFFFREKVILFVDTGRSKVSKQFEQKFRLSCTSLQRHQSVILRIDTIGRQLRSWTIGRKKRPFYVELLDWKFNTRFVRSNNPCKKICQNWHEDLNAVAQTIYNQIYDLQIHDYLIRNNLLLTLIKVF